MNRGEFQTLMAEEFNKIHNINATKGKDYAGDEDVLTNFKRHAEALDLTPEKVWAVYAGKHWDSIQSFCKHGRVESEPIEDRLRDLILYSFLLLGMVKESSANLTEILNLNTETYRIEGK